MADKLSTEINAKALYICEYYFKGTQMKKLIAIVMASFALSAFAAEPAVAPASAPKSEMKLAKKKDHSKDKKVDATKSPSKKTETSKK